MNLFVFRLIFLLNIHASPNIKQVMLKKTFTKQKQSITQMRATLSSKKNPRNG
jgi:hypothetical protein